MVRSLRLLLVVLGLTLAVGIPLAWANAVPVAINISPVGPTPAGLQSVVTFDARGAPAAANAGYYSRPVLISNNTLGGLAKGLARRAIPVAAFSAAVAAAGWAIDELTKQVQTPGQGEPTIPTGGSYWSNGMSGNFFSTPQGAAKDAEQFVPPSYAPLSLGSLQTTPTGVQYYGLCSGAVGGCVQGWIAVTLYQNIPAPVPNAGYAPAQAVPDADLANMVKNTPALWNDALRNPDGSVNRNPDVQAAAQALANELANQTGPQPDPTENWDDGNQGGEPQPGTTAQEWPGFCSWATTVCDWIDWTQQEPVYGDEDEYELPIIDPLENAPTWQSGLGSGVCPSPRVVDTFVGTISIPFDIFCQLAEMLRGLVIAAAYLSAAYILLGVRRG